MNPIKTAHSWVETGGTIKWFLGVGLLIYTRFIPAVAIWFGVIYLVDEVATDPQVVWAWVGIGAVFIYLMGKIDSLFPISLSPPHRTRSEDG